MAKRGPKTQPPTLSAIKGDVRPCREVAVLFADHSARQDPEVMASPAWLSAAAKKIWLSKTDRYRQRAQKIAGFEDSLAQFCALEADLIAMYRKKQTPPMAMVTAHRVWSSEFYDTPASQVARPGSTKPTGNRFEGNGKRPA